MKIAIQTPKATKIKLQKITEAIHKVTIDLNSNSMLLAKCAYELMYCIPWKMTEYNSFKQYILKTDLMNYGTAGGMANVYKRYLDKGYTQVELKKLGLYFSIGMLTKVIAVLNRKIEVNAFIKTYQGSKLTNINFRAKRKQTGLSTKLSGKRVFMTLSPVHTTIFIRLLKPHGAVISKTGMLMNMSSAMESYLDSL
jgi:hypothetical protein